MRSDSTGRVIPKTCKRWTCPDCNLWLRNGAREYLVAGIASGPQDSIVTFLTVTDAARAQLDVAAFGKTWNRTILRLRREYGVGGYGLAREFQRRGALHGHALVRVPRDFADRLPGAKQAKRTPAEWRFHFRELVPLVQELGWGRMVDWRRTDGNVADAASYAAKSLASYATKEAYVRFKEAGARRIRPLQASRDWVPGMTLRDFQRGAQVDPGPWRDVTAVCARL